MADLVGLERQGWDALVAGRGPEFYARMLTPEALVVVPGMLLDRRQTLASWEGLPPWSAYEFSDERVIPLGTQAALVTYRVSARRSSDEEPYRARLTSVYVRSGGSEHDGWRLAFHQQTPLPATSDASPLPPGGTG